MFAKFKPPSLTNVTRPCSSSEKSDSAEQQHPAKRQRLSEPLQKSNLIPSPFPSNRQRTSLIESRKPLLTLRNPAANFVQHAEADGNERTYNVLWRKFSNKKHKTWDGDGCLHVVDGYACLQDVSGKEMGKVSFSGPLLPGSNLTIGGREVEVDSLMSREDRQQPFRHPAPGSEPMKSEFKKPPPLRTLHTQPAVALATKPGVQTSKPIRPVVLSSKRTQVGFKNPLRDSSTVAKVSLKEVSPRHDPHAPGALVMKRPKRCPKDKQIVDVVVDPLLTRHLREHQREGVKFLYECVMGMREDEMRGAVLADEMGLGKTLQTIALIWTLLKQNPIADDSPVVKKALIVCPVTLINNWRKEFRKWLGSDRLGVYVFDDTKKRITDFTKGKAYNVMIIGYEKIRSVHEELKKGHGVDIVIADEGHRLKTAKNKSALAIKNLDTAMRVILSGTPIQNDLSEFFMMVDFVNPGLLASYKSFHKEFETPILRSRQPEATTKEKEKGEEKSEGLVALTSKFILRRNADILAKYLPPKTEYILLCQPTNAQASAYHHVLSCPAFQSVLGSPESALQLITILKKVCNSPSLLNPKISADEKVPINPMTQSLLESIPAHLLRGNQSSTKIRVLDQLLHTLRTKTTEKIVLVSNYTATLDLLENLLTSLSHPYVRLDGSTPSSKRQDIIDTFNRSPASTCFAFLLSAKSGGVGLNLIGASRLVLFDVDWNPATDLQAMARIHRDGQKRPCVIYRLVMAGALDEKIWQRQVTKLGLAGNIMDQKAGVSKFSREELKDLFRLHEGQGCQTHELSGCLCGGRGLPDDSITTSTTAQEESDDIGGNHEHEVHEIEDSDDDEDNDQKNENEDEELPDWPSLELKPANQVNMEAQEQMIQNGKKKKNNKEQKKGLDLLMEYSHIDTSRFPHQHQHHLSHNDKNDHDTMTMMKQDEQDMEALIHDDVLLDVLKDEGNRISFVFAKTSG